MKTILLTGSTGYLGKKVIDFFIKKKIKIICLQRKIPKKKNKKCEYFTYQNAKSIKNKNIELLIHLAAADPENSKKASIIKKNLKIDKTIIQLKKNNEINKVFFSSSNSVFFNNKVNKIHKNTIPCPKNYYGISKIKSEKIIKKNFTNYLILRLPSVIDKDLKKGLIFRIKEKIKKNENLYIYNLNEKFNNLFHVNDMIKILNYYYKKKGKVKKIFNICSVDQITMNDLIKYISKKLKRSCKIIDCGNDMNYKIYNSEYSSYFENIKFWKIKKIINCSF